MAPRLLLPPAPPAEVVCTTTGTVCVRILLSPIRGQDGAWRWQTQEVPAGRTVRTTLPAVPWLRVILAGRVLSETDQDEMILSDGDELLCIPPWGELVTAGALTFWGYLALAGATAAVSMGLQYGLSYLLRPHTAATIKDSFEADEPTFSFTGIRTATGPGAMVPVIYGQHRVGGQLLTHSVEQAVTEVHEGVNVYAASVQAQAQSPTMTLLLGISEGPIEQIRTETIELNGQPITNFPNVQVFTRLGTADQTAIPEFGELRNTYSDGREIPYGGSILYTTEDVCTAFVLNIAFLQGLYYIGERGDKQDNIVTVGYRYRVSPAGPWQEGPLDGLYKTILYGGRTTAVRAGIRRQGLASAIYDIEIHSTYAASIDETRAQYRAWLESVTEVQPNVQTYPHTALLGLKAVATDQLQGGLPNVTVEVYGRTCRIDSFSAGSAAWTPNPAWCVMDMLTNDRYGLGLPDAAIDLASFIAYGAYCGEQIDGEMRHRLDYVLDREVRGQPLLLEMMGGSRATLIKTEGQWHARPTRNDAAVQLLNAANCTNVRLTYLRDTDTVNVLEARFANETTKYAQDVQSWPVLADWPAVVHKGSLELRGVTKPARVQRALQFELNRRRLETLSIEFEAALDALVLQPHDVFRFAHPLPGWGVSGRLLAESTPTVLHLDMPVTFVLGQTYHVYIRHHNGVTEVRDVVHPGAITTSTITLTVGLNWGGELPRQTLWAFGRASPEMAVRLFRVVRMERTGEQTIRIQAILHNGAIYDEPVAQPLPVGTNLFNPLGPPPPLTQLVLMELVRVQPSGASLLVVNISWDVAPLSAGYAPYGGAQVFRRIVESNALSGVAQAGVVSLGTSQASNDGTGNFVPLAYVNGQILDLDDYTVMPGLTYVYRVVPVSGRGVPNTEGAREAIIHVSGPTTGNFFPGTVQNLRLAGQAVGVTVFDGPDIHLEWDAVASSPLFTDTFYVQDYVVEAWAPGQAYLLRRSTVPTAPAGVPIRYTYTLQMNSEDHVRAGQPGAQRTILFLVYARTNTNRVSLLPAQLQVTNPPPDMSMIVPEVLALFEAGIIEWNQWAQPRDFDHYVIYLDTISPPVAIYQDVPGNFQKIAPMGLQADIAYYVYIMPYDTFGAGVPSQIATFTPVSLSTGQLDTTPPSVPTGLTLTTGSNVSDDGSIIPWVQASWTASPEADVRGYEVHWMVAPSAVPTVQLTGVETSIRLRGVPGNVTVTCKVAAFDKFRNTSAFTAEQSITTGTDNQAPPAINPVTIRVFNGLQAVMLDWSPPADLDYLHTEVWANAGINNRLDVSTQMVGIGTIHFTHTALHPTGTSWYYWFRTVDTSGNMSAFVPGDTAGKVGTPIPIATGDIGNLQITETKIANDSISSPKIQANAVTASEIAANVITSGHLRTDTAVITVAAQIANLIVTDAHITTLTATKLLSGTLQATTLIYVGPPSGPAAGALYLDGNQRLIAVHDEVGTVRAVLGKLGALGTDYGLQVYNAAGQMMFSATAGGVTAQGISTGVVTASHLRTDTAVITQAAQIANALITYAHIAQAAIQTGHIGDLQVTTAKIGDAQITNAKIVSLTADKITTGTLTSHVLHIAGGGGSSDLYLDGTHQHLAFFDTGGVLRGVLGRRDVTTNNYGLWLWNGSGQLMWDFSTGAQTPGIADGVVQTQKITVNAVTESIAFYADGASTVTQVNVALGTIQFPSLNTGDQVWVSGQAIADTVNASNLELSIWEGNTATMLWMTRSVTGTVASMAVQYVYTAPENLINQTFTLVASSAGTSVLTWKSLVGLRRKR